MAGHICSETTNRLSPVWVSAPLPVKQAPSRARLPLHPGGNRIWYGALPPHTRRAQPCGCAEQALGLRPDLANPPARYVLGGRYGQPPRTRKHLHSRVGERQVYPFARVSTVLGEREKRASPERRATQPENVPLPQRGHLYSRRRRDTTDGGQRSQRSKELDVNQRRRIFPHNPKTSLTTAQYSHQWSIRAVRQWESPTTLTYR